MQKKLVLLLIFIFMVLSCSNSQNITSPKKGGNSSTIIGGDFSDLYIPDLEAPDGIIEDPTYELPNIQPTPPWDRNKYPSDPGPEAGGLLTVVTPYIYADERWGTEWLIREKDSKRAEYLWNQILTTFQGNKQTGLGIVFGEKFESDMGGEPKHPQLKRATPDTLRLYLDGKNFHQPFDKTVRDFGTIKVKSTQLIKQYKGAVIVYVDEQNSRGSWNGKYTIGGVYYNPNRLAYGNGQGYREDGFPMYDPSYKVYFGEDNYYTAGNKDEEIMVIRTDIPVRKYNNKQYWKVDLLFVVTEQYGNPRGIVINKSKIHRYSDPVFKNAKLDNKYIFAMKHSEAISLPRTDK